MSKKQKSDELAVEAILDGIREARNFDFHNYKRATLRRRIERRVSDRGCRSLSEYQALLERQPAEFYALISSMLIKVTSFFRDQETWDDLGQPVLPQLLAEKRPGEEIRVWCAGCATGEEAFSIAILLAEVMGNAFQHQEVKILGSILFEDVTRFAALAAELAALKAGGNGKARKR